MSPELETLDQLLGGDMPLRLVRGWFDDHERFVRGILAMLADGDVRLIDVDGTEVPRWKWQEVLQQSADAQLSISEAGARRIR